MDGDGKHAVSIAAKESIRTDVCIVGAGIAGLTTACLLAREGRSVVVLDDGSVCGLHDGRRYQV